MTTHQNKQQHQITHLPVMLAESLQGLKIQPEGCYLDATFGRGGHSAKILEQLGPQGRLIVLDRDPQAIAQARQLAEADRRVDVHYGQFTEITDLLGKDCQLNGVIFDLGISSPQIDQAERGFSFQQSGPLDMRMNNTKGLSAQDWLATTDKDEIAWVLSAYGEESYAEKIADQIVTRREKRPLTTTKDLVETVLAAVPTIAKGKHPATRVFQAIRMHINAELDEIRYGIPQAINQLTRSGRLVVISYHSLEHKLVSEVVKQAKINSEFSASTSKPPKLRKVGHAKKASRQELFANRRARSALLRTWEIK